jgi:hypothetical protein
VLETIGGDLEFEDSGYLWIARNAKLTSLGTAFTQQSVSVNGTLGIFAIIIGDNGLADGNVRADAQLGLCFTVESAAVEWKVIDATGNPVAIPPLCPA